jgi:hypothetical protein
MLIRWDGLAIVRRIVAGWTWTAESSVQDVDDPDVIPDLLTSPSGEFTVDPADPLAEFVGTDNAAQLALAGIVSIEALAEAGEGDEVAGLANETGITEDVLAAWIEAAMAGAPEVRAIEVIGVPSTTVHAAEFYRRFR